MRGKFSNNKGFSLVELIIVIAIMAILVGVMAPQLIKYIEKAKVSSDVQLCDTVKSAILITMNDSEVFSSSDTNDANWIADFTTPGDVDTFPAAVSSGRANAKFYKNVIDICGFDIVGFNRKNFKSSPANSSGTLCYAVSSTGNDFIVFINNSDITGNKTSNTVSSLGTNDPTVYDNIDTSGLIYAK